jgi:hypothetical protein
MIAPEYAALAKGAQVTARRLRREIMFITLVYSL